MLLLFSGFGQMPMYQRYNVVKIPGLAWSSNYEITLFLHYISAAIFTAALLFHLVYHARRKEFDIIPRKGDISASMEGLLAMVGLAEEPHHGKFQAKQRVIYAVFTATGIILVVTGLVKSYKNLGAIVLDPIFLQWMAFAHTIAGMFFMVLFLAHLAALLLLYRPMIPSMFTGEMDREYASKHHPEWL
jgi:cytochrome b subunit of formate dehydrogenase